jgi:hypothetical protein
MLYGIVETGMTGESHGAVAAISPARGYRDGWGTGIRTITAGLTQ